jgi:NAD(P)-dependent dehydrogenase (short-subunit alcohol dehydrogenase family)
MGVRYGLEGKVALITGTGQGIGRAIALALAAEGVKLALADIDLKTVKQTTTLVEAIATPSGIAKFSPLVTQLDVSDSSEVRDWVGAVRQYFEKIDIMISNAGVFPRKTLAEMSETDWDEVLDVNLKGLYHCTKAVLPAMTEQKNGSIITLSSSAAFEGVARGVHYSASKAGQIGFVRAAALELAPHNIRINAVAPGITDTIQPRLGLSEEQIKERAKTIPLGRIGHPEDVAEAVLWLCSDGANYLTGQTIHVNGGSYRV